MSDIKFDDDKPIEEYELDKLGREEFSFRLAESISNWCDESLVLGLCGSWGSGKTSIINLALKKIDELNEEEKPIIIKFNPWLLSNKKQIIKTFFDVLIPEIKSKSASDKLKEYVYYLFPELSDKRAQIKFYFEKLIFNLSNVVLFLAGIFDAQRTKAIIDISKYVEDRKIEDKNLELLKKKIDELIRGNEKQILIVIDDIDRLDSEEIQLIFHLVKLADFSNTIYLLAFDPKIVSKALENESFDGSEYLKKLVQITIEIPSISEIDLKYLFMDYLCKLIDVPKKTEEELNENFNIFFKFYLRNIRDIKRFMNNIRFTYDLVKDDVYLYDYLFITVIQMFKPDLYQEIYKNKEVFCDNSMYVSEEIIEDHRKKISEIYDIVKEIQPETLKSCLASIFPKIPYTTDPNYDIYNTTVTKRPNELKLLKRIRYPEYFETYFKFGVPNWELSKLEFDIVFDSDTASIFHNKFIKLADNKKIKFLNIVKANMNTAFDIDKRYKNPVSETKLKMFVEYYIHQGYSLSGSVIMEMEKLVEEYIQKYDPEINILIKMAKNVKNPLTLWYLIDELSQNDLINNVVFGNLQLLCVKKVESYLQNYGFKNLRSIIDIIYFWRTISLNGQEVVKNFLLKLDDQNFLILISELFSLGKRSVKIELYELFLLNEDINTSSKDAKKNKLKLENRLLNIDKSKLNDSNKKQIEQILNVIKGFK